MPLPARGCRGPLLRASPPFGRPASEDTTNYSADLLGPLEDFTTAINVNQVLGNLLALIASGRIGPRRAAIVAYTCQLLLSSLPAVKDELHEEEMDRQEALWRQNPQPLPATPQAFAGAVYECVLGTKPPSNLAPSAPAQAADKTSTPPRNLIK